MDQTLVLALLREDMPRMLGAVVGWTVLGGLLGLIVGLLAFFLIRAWGGYRLQGKWSGLWQVLTAVFTVLVALGCGGVAGFHEGTWRGVERLAKDGAFSERYLAPIGHAGALLLAGLYCLGDETTGALPTQDQLIARVKAFERGTWEINAAEMDLRMSRLSVTTVNAGLTAVKSDLQLRFPGMRNPRVNRMVSWFLEKMALSAIPGEADSALARSEVVQVSRKIIRGLPAEAAKAGNPATVGCAELSTFVGWQALKPLVMHPLRDAMRANEFAALLFFLVCLLVPVGIFRLVGFQQQRRAKPEVLRDA